MVRVVGPVPWVLKHAPRGAGRTGAKLVVQEQVSSLAWAHMDGVVDTVQRQQLAAVACLGWIVVRTSQTAEQYPVEVPAQRNHSSRYQDSAQDLSPAYRPLHVPMFLVLSMISALYWS
jgi:hypothetical protein